MIPRLKSTFLGLVSLAVKSGCFCQAVFLGSNEMSESVLNVRYRIFCKITIKRQAHSRLFVNLYPKASGSPTVF